MNIENQSKPECLRKMQQIQDGNNGNSSELSEKKYRIFGLLIILFAIFVRLFDLGDRVFHHDESVHASFTLKLLKDELYTYDPAYHGPFLFHSTTVIFHYLGINDTTARLIPVLFGVATIPLVFWLKKELGKRGVLWTAFLLSFSPSMVYFSRFFRNDLIIVFCTLATVVGGTRYLENLHSLKRLPYLILAASSLGIAVSSKENAYLVILMFGAYSGLYLLYRFYSDWKKEKSGLIKTLKLKTAAVLPFLPEILLSIALCIFIIMFFYTSYFRNSDTLFSVVERAFSHWMEMHKIERIGGPFYYYIPILLVYESPILLFGIAGIVYFLKRKDKNSSFFLFLSYWAVASLLLYSYLQEKVPWLVVHIVLPFGILAGAYLGEFFSSVPEKKQIEKESTEENKLPEPYKIFAFQMDRSELRALITGVLALTLIIFLVQCISVNFYRSMEDSELMTHTQATTDIRELMEKIEGFSLSRDTLNIYVVDPDNLYLLLPWYLRDYEKISYSRNLPSNIQYDAIIVPASYQMYREIPEEDFALYNFSLRPGKEYALYYNEKLEKKR
jgi:uncharacterized protein (TIGR03663 family)